MAVQVPLVQDKSAPADAMYLEVMMQVLFDHESRDKQMCKNSVKESESKIWGEVIVLRSKKLKQFIHKKEITPKKGMI